MFEDYNPQIAEEQKTKWPKGNVQKNKQRSTYIKKRRYLD
jgi:hypothetical protein